MNEADTRAELIDPQLRAAGWGEVEGFFAEFFSARFWTKND